MENSEKNNNLKTYVDKFLYYEEVITGKSYNTIKSYKKDIMQFIDYLNEYEEIDEFENVETITFRSFIAYLNSTSKENNDERKVVSKRSINRKISALRTFFKYLQEKKIVKTNKVNYITMPKFEKELPNVLGREDINKLRDAVNTSKITGIRDRLIIELLYSSGIRASELIDLNEYMINIEERELRVIGKGNKERITFFSENSKKWLEKYIEEKKEKYSNYTKDVVFANSKGEKLTTRSLRRLIADYAKKAGLQKEVTPHVFRHTFATELLNNGVDIRYLQELLGHSSISTTQVYTHVSKALLKDVYMNTHPLARE
ncbi:site-specific tyrosine recombinase/integron integrase [Pseudoleptotrichia goodfellowii]|uniref:Tyrosine recombinase XerC n=1 Tax=Pseudoleptotrichia goodfellowii F0264 TaxID=596323 RepID=D0GKA9_9FUSO|nr:site-specific tyrosine recombinase/integron integrase [Pseudoleptotrichia goodfellowii]EEY35474.1 phage integrase SAM-like domain protein [Pseudoleptotrichia goodfellowii F0264]MBF4806950.1 tyrosine recombinase [Pseudoleptotrichia goodfellowii]